RPKAPSSSSTNRRLSLASFIDDFGDIMPVACRNCRVAGLSCRVHVRSGRCNECNRKNLRNCNIQISENEWVEIRDEKNRLQARLDELRQKEEEMRKEKQEIQEALRVNAEKAAEAIAVEDASLTLLEQQEGTVAPSDGLALSPFTWSAMSGLGDEIWAAGVPDYLGDSRVESGGTVPASGDNS
ncbi:hypothetical protein M011DRAFT_466871, partial [Sporormia fimetaria CBS 119925]